MNNGFSHSNGLEQHMYGLKNEALIRSTSVCCSGSFMLSKILKTILNRSCHQCFSKVCP